jgi:hypothetical protein
MAYYEKRMAIPLNDNCMHYKGDVVAIAQDTGPSFSLIKLQAIISLNLMAAAI